MKIQMTKDQMLKPYACPFCGAVHECATSATDKEERPGVGDISICTDCGQFAVWTEFLDWRKLTLEDMRTIPAELLAQMRFVQKFIQSRKLGTN